MPHDEMAVAAGGGADDRPIARRSLRPTRLVIGLSVVVVAIAGIVLFKLLGPQPYAGEGVSNARIDSPTRIEFDYRPSASCSNLNLEYKFFDSTGKQVDDLADTKPDRVDGGRNYHFVITAQTGERTIDSRAVRFVADATCNP